MSNRSAISAVRDELHTGDGMLALAELTEAERRRHRSARHYTLAGKFAGRLQTTVALAARTLGFPIAMVSILDGDTQHIVSLVGTEAAAAHPRSLALCDAVVRTGLPIIVEDARHDERFARLPAVAAGQVGSYLGVPLLGREALVIGSICVLDTVARAMSTEQVSRLISLGEIVEDQLDLIRRLHDHRSYGALATTTLAGAIERDEIRPWYQPIVELSTGRTVGFEALARWHEPSGAVADPMTFVPLAEDSDLVLDLDLTIMRQALQELAWLHRSRPDQRMSVNLSTRHLRYPDAVARIHEVALRAGVRPQSVDLELTETAQLTPELPAGNFVAELRDRGFQVWLDDFGTGFSTLEYLMQMPVNGIKIDRVVTVGLGTPVANAVTASVAGLARQLGLHTVIEGIATPEHAELAAALGCEFGQGFLWATPTPSARFPALG